MRLENNDVELTRRERKALDAESRHLAAAEIGRVWSEATARVSALQERIVPGEPTICNMGGFGLIPVQSAGYYELKRLNRQRRCLEAMGPVVLAIDMETLQPTEEL